MTTRLSEMYPELPRGEQAIVRVLLGDYPFAALGSLRSLADRAEVSPPTASRLIARLGWSSFAQFQSSVRAQSREHDRSRLREFVSTSPAAPHQAAEELLAGLSGTVEAATEPLLDRIGALLAGAGGVWGIGGPLSELAADYLVRQLSGLRPRVRQVPHEAAARARVLVDIGPQDLIVAYDFRRYSQSAARFVRAARARGARLVLVTDAWGSPMAPDSDVLLRLPSEAAGPIAPLTHIVAVTELILVATVPHLTGSANRLEELDGLTMELDRPEDTL
ncbi:MurR/RpiR family transcriptional regulator [Streptomyces alboniger]|uniref:MurR/RpiR family transcriptional regulator n=1 Tax=Streptomyces alboniger TaxID=132473 RepID=A0A5J6HPB5_STRAD|nr:MurR/RpiR family transcriptional regulator [Streptomyces alboniger]QEV21032.1 MurR/RpiR family transcriptional regulator [Streptomyces alboniger]